MESIEQKVHILKRPESRKAAEKFIDFLIREEKETITPKPRKTPTLSWFGALKDLRDQYTSVELQHEIAKMRSGES